MKIPMPLIRSLTLAAVAIGCAAPASADILDLYVGAGLGQSQIRADVPNGASFRENHSAWKAMAGVRVVSLFGAEVQYLDFGNPSGTVAGQSVRADLNGKSVMGLVYVPIPLPVLDVFAKAGYTRLDGSVTVSSSTVLRSSSSDDAFTYGAGVQLKFAGWGVRGEYERFSASGSDPSLWTVSLAKHFF